MNTDELSNIIVKKLESNFDKLSKQFFQKSPYTSSKFFILDDLLPKEITFDIYENLPNKDSYKLVNSFRENKLTFKELNSLENSLIENITNAFQKDNVIKAVERITNINHLIADPSLYAGGLSRMDLGHFLNPHIDNSHNAKKIDIEDLTSFFM
jgi:Rps23 Pro-64 3,4-dihydroxylase Tpa1-like proline 4-hydroxylase